jgi:hypothetical protein
MKKVQEVEIVLLVLLGFSPRRCFVLANDIEPLVRENEGCIVKQSPTSYYNQQEQDTERYT